MVELNLKINNKTLRAKIKRIELGCVNSKTAEEKLNKTILI